MLRAGVGLALLVVVGAGTALYLRFERSRVWPEGLVQANGRIEGDHVTIASKFAGRVQALHAREGASVERGQVVAVLDDTQTRARVAQAGAALEQAAARVRQAAASVAGAMAEEAQAHGALAQAQARVIQARASVSAAAARTAAARTALGVLRREVEVMQAQAEAGLAQARAGVARAEASEVQARRDAERYGWLVEQGLVERQRGEQAELAWTTARSDLVSARSAVDHAGQRLAEAGLGPDRVRAREDDLRALEAGRAVEEAGLAQAEAAAEQARASVGKAEATLSQARAALAQAQAARDQAQAALAEAESVREDLTIVTPAAGVVVTRVAEVGEVVAAGAPLLEVVDLDRLYLKVFVPEAAIGRVRLGLPARVFTDAFPDRPFAATVRYIASRAEFTPKDIQTPDERVKLVYAVRLYLDENPQHRLTPGLPADAVIRWREGTPWRRPRW